jgi:ADP-heptose:LPS heptosyltransferase
MRSPDPLAAAARILAVRLDNAGDVVLLGPAVRALREAYPRATIKLLGSPAGARASVLLPWLDGARRLEAPWQDAFGTMPLEPDREWRAIERLREGSFDAVLIFGSFAQTAWPVAYACYLAGIPIRAAHAIGFGGSVLTHQIEPVPVDWHEAERNLHLVEALGVPVRDRSLGIAIPDDDRRAVAGLLEEIGVAPTEPMLLVVPGASAPARRLKPAPTGRIASSIARLRRLRVVVAGSEREKDLGETLARSVPGAVSLAGRTSIEGLAALVERASLVLTGNSLAMHLADALRTPALVLFSGTDRESNWAPRHTQAVTLRQPTSCAPCLLMECPFHQQCLDIEPEAALAAAQSLVADHPTRSQWLACAS